MKMLITILRVTGREMRMKTSISRAPKKIIDIKTRRDASWGRKSKAGGKINQRSWNCIHYTPLQKMSNRGVASRRIS